MEQALASPALQLGALGAVIVFMVLFMRQQAAHALNQAEKRADRDAFIEGLVTRAFEVQDAHLESWREMTRQTIRAYQEVGVAYNEMHQALEANCEAILNGTKQSHEEHSRIDMKVSRTLENLEKMAG